jgi:hypothetical protein
VTVDTRPIWWHAVEGNPPIEWQLAFEALTDEEFADKWGLAAAVFIARTRRRTGRGPTFSEMFRALLPEETGALPEWPAGLNYHARFQLMGSFRLHVAIQWKRQGWINWDTGVERSLRVGRRFREESRARQADKPADTARRAEKQ